MQPRDISTTICYIEDSPLWEIEKPYVVTFPVSHIPQAETSNLMYEKREVVIHDVRGQLPFELDEAGFCFVKSRTLLKLQEFTSVEIVQTRYFEEIRQLLQHNFPQYSRIIYMDHTLRKRDPAFPSEGGTITEYAQPLTLGHCDYTEQSSRQRLEQIVAADGLVGLEDLPYDQINVWRVIKGPNNDWPLAVLDYRTVDLYKDPLLSDQVMEDAVSENRIIRANPNHRWYYMSDQDVDDVLILRNTSSEGRSKPYAWHSAFDTKISSTYRESIDIRFFAFLDK